MSMAVAQLGTAWREEVDDPAAVAEADEEPSTKAALEEALAVGGPQLTAIGGWGDVWHTRTRRDVTIRFPFSWDEEETCRIEIAADAALAIAVVEIVDGGGVLRMLRDLPDGADPGAPPYKWVVYRRTPRARPHLPFEEPAGLEERQGLEPIPAPGEHTLELDELIVWLAINEARDEGDEERALRYFSALYRAGAAGAAPMVQNYRADYVFYSTSKTIEETFAKITPGTGGTSFDVSRRGERKKVETHLAWDAKTGLTPYHRAVYDKAMDFYRAGLPYFTVRQLCTALTGSESDANITKTAEERAAAAVADLSETYVWIDAMAEVSRYKTDVTGAWSALPLVPVRPLVIKDKRGNLIEGYRFTGEEPPLHAHDMAIGQYTALPTAAFRRISGAVSMTPAAMTMRDYLIRRVARMSPAQNKIRYDAVAEETGNKGMKRADLREKVRRILVAFRAEGRILGFSEYRGQDGRPAGVQVRIKVESAKKPARKRTKGKKASKKSG